MTSEFGHKLNPHRKLRIPRGSKGMRRTILNTHVPANIDQGGILTVRFPDMGQHDVIIPGTEKLSFKITLNLAADPNRTICNSLGRAIASKIEVKLEGKSVFTLDDSDIFLSYQDPWKTSEECKNAAYHGICSEAIRKIRIDANNKYLSNAKNKAVGTTYSNRFFIPLDFELLTSHMPFFQHELRDKLSYELTFNSYGKVIVSTDTDASYRVSDIHLEYEKNTSPAIALSLKTNNKENKYSALYYMVRNLLTKKIIWDIKLSPNTKSMKGILMLFINPNDSSGSYARDSEKLYNLKLIKVSITLGGNPNQLYSSGMINHQQWGEIRKHFADGRHRTVSTVAKELELSDITLYLTTKYGLWLDMRTTDDDSLHHVHGREKTRRCQPVNSHTDRKRG